MAGDANSEESLWIRQRLQQAQAAYASLGDDFLQKVVEATEMAVECLLNQGGIFLLGNGGSAADAQHWTAELVGRYLHEREPLNVHALTVNSSTLTALVNDYPAERLFERQVRAHLKAGDLLVAISTSGQSANVLRAVEAAKALGARTLAVTGRDGGKLAPICDLAWVAPSADTPRIQEMHLLFGHLWCEGIERRFVQD
ncbi:MAG: SIS domain-containing protein [Planctomycetota bacterium]|nr:MAG: SIS domain-containing protein [Planctomycetota bacterium]